MEEKRNIIPFYGRKRAHGLSDTQKNSLFTLYKLYGIILRENVVDPREWFEEKFDEIILEIGFGNGERLINHAISRPDCGFIGCDPFENGVATILQEIRAHNLKNVKIFNGDVRLLLEKCRERSLRQAYALFPDPWRKKKHHKRRLLSAEFISNLVQKMALGGNIVIATDHEDYMADILKNLKEIPNIGYCSDINQLCIKPGDLQGTKYERKALSQERKCYYLTIYLC